MSSLFGALNSAGAALSVFEQALSVSQNNIDNVSTPGYARQALGLEAMSFQPLAGLIGGVNSGELQSARDAYADQSVRSQLSAQGSFDQQVQSLTPVNNAFDLTSQSGIATAWNNLLQSFSGWSVTPDDVSLQQNVLNNAQALATAFQTAAKTLNQSYTDADGKVSSLVSQINILGGQIASYNQQVQQSTVPDAGMEAKINASLEQLSQLADVSATKQPDGTYTVLIGGQTPLVIGGQQYNLSNDHAPASASAQNQNAPTAARILDSQGRDITAQISQGQLGGVLQVRNQFLPSLLGDDTQAGDLNTLAKSMADEINGLLTAGQVSSGPPPVNGVALFTYDTTTGTASARTFAVSSGVTAGQLAAIDPGPPVVANGTALKLANLANTASTATAIGGMSYTNFLGVLSSRVGNALTSATNGQDAQKQAVAQAQTLRDQISGVDLNQEAVQVVQFQRAYQASAQMVSILNSLTQTVVNMLQ
ncbi:MAG: flagellar hook-associated protein FlgK [Bryobacteraceae bacterium]